MLARLLMLDITSVYRAPNECHYGSQWLTPTKKASFLCSMLGSLIKPGNSLCGVLATNWWNKTGTTYPKNSTFIRYINEYQRTWRSALNDRAQSNNYAENGELGDHCSRGRCLVYRHSCQLFYTPRVLQGAFVHEKGRLKSDRIINHKEQPKHPAITARKQAYNGKLKVKRRLINSKTRVLRSLMLC